MPTDDTTATDTPACLWCGHPCKTAWDDAERCEVVDCFYCGFRRVPSETGGPSFPDDKAA
jgi:hypothetical protein